VHRELAQAKQLLPNVQEASHYGGFEKAKEAKKI